MVRKDSQDTDPAQADSADEVPAGPGAGADDALRRLEERLGRASSAAERLVADAAAAAAAAGATRKPPDAGWQIPSEDGEEGARRREGDLEVLAAVLQSLRDLVPADLQRRLTDALREVLLALRALIDWYLERAEQRRERPVEAQDIPIL